MLTVLGVFRIIEYDQDNNCIFNCFNNKSKVTHEEAFF